MSTVRTGRYVHQDENRLDPVKHREAMMKEDVDMDGIPDFIERTDGNPRTIVGVVNFPFERYLLGNDRYSKYYYEYVYGVRMG